MYRRQVDPARHLAQLARVALVGLHSALAHAESLDQRRRHYARFVTEARRVVDHEERLGARLDDHAALRPGGQVRAQLAGPAALLLHDRAVRCAYADL